MTQKEKGLDTSSSHKPISEVHLKQIFDNYFMPHWDNDPTCLMRKVYFAIAFFTGNRGVEGLRELTKTSFVIKVNAENREYMELSYNQATKNLEVMTLMK